jgi:EAL domain-containing protein (putative c-di-GMP-specific phosphodiesterase class I)
MMLTTAKLLEATDPVAYIKSALAQKQFSLYAQPMLALKGTQEFPMAELFVRMREEESALLPPGDFFQILEAFRMMPELDRWVVREALERMRSHTAFKSLCINVAKQTIEDGQFPAYVAGELKFAGIAAERLTFEITEKNATASLKATRIFSEGIRAVGARLLIEDFSCTSTSFDLLSIVGANYVKVDGGIVRKLGLSDAANTLVGNVVRMAAARALGVIGAAVEDRRTLGLLRHSGVDFAQGTGVSCVAALERPVIG